MVVTDRKLEIRKNIEQNLFLYVLILFICSLAVRYILSDFVKTLYVYGDELLYYQIADHMLTHRGIAVYNAVTTFKKIFYSFLLMPGLIAKDSVLRGHMLALINAGLMSSSIFPVYFLAKEHISDKVRILLLCGISIIMPDLVYSMTFMSENAFLPMALWLVYLFTILFKNEEKNQRSILLSIGIGVLAYFSYFCKDVALVFLAAYILFEVYNLFIRIRARQDFKDILIHLALILGVFMVFSKGVDFLLFRPRAVAAASSSGSSYSVLERFPYAIYSAFYYGLYIILGIGVLPALFPLVRFKNLPEKTKRLYIFLILLSVVAAGVVAIKIYIREDYLHTCPRAHLRYVTYLWMPFLVAYSSLLESDHESIPKWQYALMAVLICICAFFYRGIVDVSSLDEMVLSYLTKFNDKLTLLFRLGLPILVLGLFWLYQKNRKVFAVLTILMFCGIQALNNAIGIVYCAFCYKVTDTELVEMTSLKETIKEHPEMNFLIIGEANMAVLDHTQRLADTFLNEPNVYTTDVYNYISKQNENGINLADTRLQGFMFCSEYPDLSYINYILIRKSFEVELNKDQCVPVDWFNNKYFDLYAVSDPHQLPNIERPQQLTDDRYNIRVDSETFLSAFLQNDDNGFRSYGPGLLLNGSSIKVSPGKYRLVFHYSIDEGESHEGGLGYIQLHDNSTEQVISQMDVPASETTVTTDILNVNDQELDLGIYFYVDRKGVVLSSIELVEAE